MRPTQDHSSGAGQRHNPFTACSGLLPVTVYVSQLTHGGAHVTVIAGRVMSATAFGGILATPRLSLGRLGCEGSPVQIWPSRPIFIFGSKVGHPRAQCSSRFVTAPLTVVPPFAAEANTNADNGFPPRVCASPAVSA